SPWAAPSAAMTARSASVPDLVGRAERGGPLFGHALRRRYVDWRRGIEERDMKHHIRSRRRTALCLGVAATLNSFAATAALATTLQERVSQRLIVRYHDSPAPELRQVQVRRTINGALARAGVA